MSGPQQRLVNKQFNSPIGLYSEQNIKEVLERESQMLANGAVGINFHNPSTVTKQSNLHNSAVLRMLEEEESRQRNGQSPGVKRVAWPPPKDEEEGDFVEQEAIQAQGGAQYSSKTPGLLSTSQTTPFNNHQQAPVVAQTYQPNKPKPFQSVAAPQAYQPAQSVGSPQPKSQEANWTTYLPDQSPGSPQPQQLIKPVSAPQSQQPIKPVSAPQQQQPAPQSQQLIKPVSAPQQQQPVSAPQPQQTKPATPTSKFVGSPLTKLPTWAPAFTPSASSPVPIVKEPNWTTYLPDQVSSPQPKSQAPTWAPAGQQQSKPLASSQPAWAPVAQPAASSQPAWAPAAQQQQPKTPTSPQPILPSGPQPFPKEYTIPIQIESRVQPTNKPNQINQDTIPVQPSAGPQGQVQQPQPQYKPAPVKQVEPPPSVITLRPTVPISQAPAPLITSQPATATLRGGKNLRGDMKWPPENVKERMDAENRARMELAKGPACRPTKVQKDYSGFFAQHALNSSYPGYKVPPGTQYYEHHPVM